MSACANNTIAPTSNARLTKSGSAQDRRVLPPLRWLLCRGSGAVQRHHLVSRREVALQVRSGCRSRLSLPNDDQLLLAIMLISLMENGADART